MKKAAILLWTVLAFGCSGEEKEIEEPWVEIEIPNPMISQMTLTEICESIESGVPDITRTEDFHFIDGWMAKYTNTQQFSAGEETIISRETAVLYDNNHSVATLTDQSGNIRTYTLNKEGYATQCIYTSAYQRRQYDFSYTNGYLTQVTEVITPTDEIGESTLSHKLTLNYKKGDLVSVISPSLTNESFNGYGENQINYEAGSDVNYYHLPCLQLLDTYPLSFHQEALYVGLLGKPTQHLTIRISPNNTTEGYSEYTQYTYKFNSSGQPTALQSRTSYSGGSSYQNGFPNKRNISINIK